MGEIQKRVFGKELTSLKKQEIVHRGDDSMVSLSRNLHIFPAPSWRFQNLYPAP